MAKYKKIDYNKLDDIGFIKSSNPTEEDFKEISKAIQAFKKKEALRDKRKKASRKLASVKAK